MPATAEIALLAIVVLMVKHWVADFLLQTVYQVKNKGRYGHPGGLMHSAIHIVCTLPVFAVLPPPSVQFAAGLLAGEYVFHYHVDWLKEQLNQRLGLKPDMSRILVPARVRSARARADLCRHRLVAAAGVTEACLTPAPRSRD